MTILDEIILQKKQEVATIKQRVSIKELELSPYFSRTCYAATEFLRKADSWGIIAEHKRHSPSKGVINNSVDIIDVVEGYEQAGASCISVLTDEVFFGGTSSDIVITRNRVKLPLLRKDFMIDEYQIVEAKSLGADIVLLIASCLTRQEILTLSKLATSLGMQVLLEVHTVEELDTYNQHIALVGVNNRNLKDFTVTIQNSLDIIPYMPREAIKISESGLQNPQDVLTLKQAGFDGFLMGENFMKTNNPGTACADFIQQLADL